MIGWINEGPNLYWPLFCLDSNTSRFRLVLYKIKGQLKLAVRPMNVRVQPVAPQMRQVHVPVTATRCIPGGSDALASYHQSLRAS